MEFVSIQSQYAFTGNPLILRHNMPAIEGSDVDGSLVLSLGGYKLYEARVSMPLNIDVAEIVDCVIDPLGTPRFADGDSFVALVEDWRMFEDRRRLDAVLTYGSGDDYESSCYVFKGGVSKQNFRSLMAMGEDIFTAKILNPAGNFFLTTRTHSWFVSIPETELSPLYFFVEPNEGIAVTGLLNGETIAENTLSPGIYALSVEMLRKWHFDNFGQIVNAFDIYKVFRGIKIFACRIVIEQEPLAKDYLTLRFRNSFGVMERMFVAGTIKYEFTHSGAEESRYNRYDRDVADFTKERTKIEVSKSILISTIVRSTDRVKFLLDLLSSEDVYIENADESLIKVIPSVESLIIPHKMDMPTPIDLKLETVEADKAIMADIISDEEFSRGRIHSRQFDNHFN